jgi:hypothetical protein
MTTLEPPVRGSIVDSRRPVTDSPPPRALALALAAILLGIGLASIDILGDSVFLGRAFWLDTAEPGMYTSQGGMFVPYLALAIRALVYIVIIVEVLKCRDLLLNPGPDAEPSRRRIAVLMVGCLIGGLGNAAATIIMFWMASYWVTGMRDETPQGVLEWVVAGDMSRLPWLGVGSVVADVILLGITGFVMTVMLLPTTKRHLSR